MGDAGKMKQIYKEEELEIPEGVTVAVKARIVTVTGPRGTLQKDLQHTNMSIRVLAPSDKAVKPVHKVKLVVWHGARKHVACLRTVRSIIENMVTGVRYGFAYKMRLVYAHFPINVIIADDKQSVEIRNFLGEKRVRNIKLLEGSPSPSPRPRRTRSSSRATTSTWFPSPLPTSTALASSRTRTSGSSSTESTCLRGVKLLRRKFERTKTQVFVGAL